MSKDNIKIGHYYYSCFDDSIVKIIREEEKGDVRVKGRMLRRGVSYIKKRFFKGGLISYNLDELSIGEEVPKIKAQLLI